MTPPNTKDNLTDVAGRLQDMGNCPSDSQHSNPSNSGTVSNSDGQTITLGQGNFSKK